jgi:hypothetical protein
MALTHEQASAILDASISQMLGTEDGVHRSMRSLPNDKQLIRGIGTLNFTPEEIRDFLWKNEDKKLWDELLEESYPIVEFDRWLKVNYEHFRVTWPVSDRDFVYAYKAVPRDDGIVMVAKSVEFGVPEREGIVRGEVTATGYFLKRVGERRTEITYLLCLDPKGSLPQLVVDFIGQKQTGNVRKIIEAMNKRAGISN